MCCGIVLTVAKTTLKAQQTVFNELLYCDALRGMHSTGVFNKTSFYKKAVMPNWLMKDKGYEDILAEHIKVGWNFLVGHNRAATVGKVNDANAHPFRHGDITMVQNGTLRDLHLMPKKTKKFDVDSEMACWAINNLGIKEALPKFNGAYTFVWHDKKDDTLHLLRNTQRPFYLQKAGSVYYGASEKDMLLWVLRRNKIAFNEADGFELEPMVEYIFEDGELTTRIARKGYVAKTTYSYASSTGGTSTKKTNGFLPPVATSANTAAASAETFIKEDKSSKAAIDRVLSEHTTNLKYGDTIDVVVESSEPKGTYYCASGYEVNTTENVLIYGLEKELIPNNVYQSKIIGAWLVAKHYGKKELVISVAARPDGKAITHLGDYDTYHGEDVKDVTPDEVVYRCDWCTADVYKSEQAEAQKLARNEGYDHTHLCLDCCDAIRSDYNPIGDIS